MSRLLVFNFGMSTILRGLQAFTLVSEFTVNMLPLSTHKDQPPLFLVNFFAKNVKNYEKRIPLFYFKVKTKKIVPTAFFKVF